jgi:hypothetical protein
LKPEPYIEAGALLGQPTELPSNALSIYLQTGDFLMAITPNRKRKPSCHNNLSDKPSNSLGFGKSDEDKKKPSSGKILLIVLITLVLGGVPTTAILHGFDGLVSIKLGLEGGSVLIDGRKSALPPVTDNSSSAK